MVLAVNPGEINRKCRLVAKYRSHKEEYSKDDFEAGEEVVVFMRVVGEKRPVKFYHGIVKDVDSSQFVEGLDREVPAMVLSVLNEGEVKSDNSFFLREAGAGLNSIRYTRIGHVDKIK